MKKNLSRKVLHIVANSMVAISPYFFENYWVNLGLFSLVTIGSFFIIRTDKLRSFNIDDKNKGIFYFPFSYIILLTIVGYQYKYILMISYLILGFSDGLASIVGNKLGKRKFTITKDKKSYVGSFVFFGCTFLIVYLLFKNIIFDLNYLIIGALLIAYVLTAIEAASSYGLDNLFIPIISMFLLYVVFEIPDPVRLFQLHIAFFLGTFAAYLSHKFKFLKKDGAFGALILAFFLYGFGNIKWIMPILVFFILSSLLSKVRYIKNSNVDLFFEKSGVRDITQVFANGGIAIIFIVLEFFFKEPLYYYLYIAYISCACADTWATEIGTYFKTTTYSIKNLKKIEQGVSGGVSVLGTLGAISGALIVALSSIFWIPLTQYNFMIIIVVGGFLGSLVDSVLGATYQAQFHCDRCDKVTEKFIHCGEKTEHTFGFRWLNNDIVNFAACMFSSLVVLLYKIIV